MTAQTKTVIKSYFETGDKPTQAQFIDFIDSYQDASANLGVITSASLGAVGLQVLSATTSASARSAIDAVNRGGDTMTGKLITVAGASAAAGFNIAVGVSPAAPANGDIWVNSSAAFIQVAGSASQIAPVTTITYGTYAVTVSGSTSGNITLDAGADTGAWERIGNFINAHGRITVASVSSPEGTGKILLPFTVANLTDSAGAGSALVTIESGVSAGSSGMRPVTIDEGANTISLYVVNPANGAFLGGANQIQAGTIINYSASYRTS